MKNVIRLGIKNCMNFCIFLYFFSIVPIFKFLVEFWTKLDLKENVDLVHFVAFFKLCTCNLCGFIRTQRLKVLKISI